MRYGFCAWTLIVALAGMPNLATAQNANCRNTENFDHWLADFKRKPPPKASRPPPSTRPRHTWSSTSASSASIADSASSRRPSSNSPTRCLPRIACRPAPTRSRSTSGSSPARRRSSACRRRSSGGFWGWRATSAPARARTALKSLTTLAYDCRRSDMFRGHLFDALRMIERGDLASRGDDRLVGGRARTDPDDALGILPRRGRL